MTADPPAPRPSHRMPAPKVPPLMLTVTKTIEIAVVLRDDNGRPVSLVLPRACGCHGARLVTTWSLS